MVAVDIVRCAAAVSTRSSSLDALAEVCTDSLAQLRAAPHLAFLFLSADHAPAAESLAERACALLGTDCVLGCTAESVIGPGREIESGPALSLWLGHLPLTAVIPMHLRYERTQEGGSVVGWADELPADWPPQTAFLVLGDPFSFPADLLVDRLNSDQPGIPVVGGMASGAARPRDNRLFSVRRVYDQGAVAVYLSGGLQLRTVLSQGCRPVGTPFVITKAEQNVIQQLGGVPAFQRLKEVFQTLATREQRMFQRGLHVGRVVNEYQDRFEQGDFLVRNVIGINAEEGSIAVGDYFRAGQTVQFHIRDAETADAELRQLLARARQQREDAPSGALLFTCNGRGSRLFGEPHHDVSAVERALGRIPVAGFFAAGELGPVGGKSFLHGFTASIALFDAP